MKKIIKKKDWKRHGVSEVVGNILILAITVTLFSSIMYFVTSMPVPNGEVYADFSTNLIYDEQTGMIINITHIGGQVLKDYRTAIYLFIDGSPRTLKFADGGLGSEWKPGDTFSYTLSGVGNNTSVSIMIVDVEANSVIFDSILKGHQTTFAPVIKSRGLIKYGTLPGSQYYSGDLVQFYAEVYDYDGDLNYSGVYVNATSIGSGIIFLSYDSSLGIFVSSPLFAELSWNGKVVTVFASDMAGRISSARLTLSVTSTSGGGGGTGGGGGPPGNLDYGVFQGFAFFEWTDWEANRFLATPRNIFERGEVIVVVVASKYLVNLQNDNTIYVLNETTKLPYYAVSTPNNQFESYDIVSGYYTYNCSINTALLPDISSYYLVSIKLKDNWNPNHVFQANGRIYVYNDAAHSEPGNPKILTFLDPEFRIQSNEFTTYDPDSNKIYVEIRNNVGADWDPYTGDVEIRDYFWNFYVKGAPKYVESATGAVDWNGPVSNLWQVKNESCPPPGVYRFVINLGNATTGSPWLPGENAYILRYDMFKAGPEKYLLTKTIYIEAPQNKLDIVVGGEPSFAARFAQHSSLYFYPNDNYWSPAQLIEISSDKQTDPPIVYIVRTGDVDGDGDTDIIAVLETDDNYFIVSYINDEGSWTKSIVALLPENEEPVGMDLGNIDYDNDLDIVVSYDNIVYLYRNDGAWSRSTVATSNYLNYVFVKDMDPPDTPGNDPSRSLDIVVGRSDGTLTIYKNTYGDGTSWDDHTLTKSGTATIYDWANGEMNIAGIVIGNYTKTQNPFQDEGVYEEIREDYTWRYASSYPTQKGPADTVEDPSSDLGNTEEVYSVLYNKTANMIGWDNTGMVGDLPIYNAILEVRYKTINYTDGNDPIIWNREGSLIPILNITESESFRILRYDLTPFFIYASDMTDLNISFHNSIMGSEVDFDYWRINVTWKTGDHLEHIWTFSVTPGLSHSFKVYATRNASVEEEYFQFYYSMDNITWTAMNTCLVTNEGEDNFVQYSYELPESTYGTIYIKISDTNRTLRANPSLDWVRIGQMYIETTAETTAIGTAIKAMAIADIDGNNANDIIVVSEKNNKGQLFVLYNREGGILNPDNLYWIVQNNADLRTAKWVDAGQFFNPYNKDYLDIVVGITTGNINNPGTSKIYYIQQISMDTFGSITQVSLPSEITGLSEFALVKMVAADIDGNRRTDLLFGTNDGYIFLYANYEGNPDMSGWQVYLVDQLEGGNSILDIDVNEFVL